jgi:hypothetical protein
MRIRILSLPVLRAAIASVALLAIWAAAGPVADTGAARYAVAQCGWKVGNDGSWLETSDQKFNRSSWCGVPQGSDAWEGVHVSSGTRGSTAAVTGTRFARWRWTAPPGTGIVNVSGDRWHVLRDEFEHRLGAAPAGGNFEPFSRFQATDADRVGFSRFFPSPVGSFESRLLCALPEDRFCSVTGTSLAAIRGLTLTIDDPIRPTATLRGAFTSGGWLRGVQSVQFSGADAGSGVSSSETLVDGALRGETWHPCESATISGQRRGTRMQPCRTGADGTHSIDTTRLSDGPHRITNCTTDFAGNRGCSAEATLKSDNTAPSAPRGLAVEGGDDWRNVNSFDLVWSDPDQGVAAPITGSRHRVTGPDGFDSGTVTSAAGATGARIAGLTVRSAGEYRVSVWLVDAAGNENPAASAEATLRFDDVEPEAFVLHPGRDTPELLRATVSDEHSGPADGWIEYRRHGTEQWRVLATRLERGDESGGENGGRFLAEDGAQDPHRARLEARFPSDDLPPGLYSIRVRAVDGAGNRTVSALRPDGTRLVLRAPLREDTRIQAGLSGAGRHGASIRVPFGSPAKVEGRLTGENGAGVAGRELSVEWTPGAGARASRSVRLVRTGSGGRFSFDLGRTTSGRVSVVFSGDSRHSGSESGELRLGVHGSLTFSATPGRLRTGERVRFRGRVRSGEARHPSRGSLVAIRYFESSSGAWRPVLVTRTDGFGRYRASYRFRYITGVARIRLRATLLPSQVFPYLPANSPVRNVRVTG